MSGSTPSSSPSNSPSFGWKFDKSIGITVVGALILQLAGAVWYGAQAYDELKDHEKRIAAVELMQSQRAGLAAEVADHEKRIAELESQTAAQNTAIQQSLNNVSLQIGVLQQKVDDLEASLHPK